MSLRSGILATAAMVMCGASVGGGAAVIQLRREFDSGPAPVIIDPGSAPPNRVGSGRSAFAVSVARGRAREKARRRARALSRK
jgi:hypothetical protein